MPPLILVVEDNPTVLRATCRTLEIEGYPYLAAQHAGQALDLLSSGQIPGLMVLDVKLPGMSGPELALRIHRSHPGIPVLFVSGWLDGLVHPDSLSPLQWDFLPKPFTPEALLDRIQYLLEQSQAAWAALPSSRR